MEQRVKFAYLACKLQSIAAKQLDSWELTDIARIFDEAIEDAKTGERPVYSDIAEAIKSIVIVLHQGKKIEAIKKYREITGYGLKESKDAIEEVESYRPASFGSLRANSSY